MKVKLSGERIVRTLEQRDVALKELMQLDRLAVECLAVLALRSYLRRLGISRVMVEGVDVSVSDAKKESLADALWDAGEDGRKVKVLEDSGIKTEEILKASNGDGAVVSVAYREKVTEIVGCLREYVDGLYDSNLKGWHMHTNFPDSVGSGLWYWLSMYVGHTGESLTPATRMVYGSRISKSIQSVFATEPIIERKDKLMQTYEMFRAGYTRLMKADKLEVMEKAKIRRLVRTDNIQEIDVTELFSRAATTLVRAYGDKKLPRWIDVSIALSLATGRRMSEIHSTGSFEYVDDNHVMFSGQLKKKGDGSAYVIPTLLPAKLIVDGHEYLKALDKYIVDDPKAAHVRFSKDIASRGMGVWYYECLPELRNYTDASGKEVKVKSYHRLREIYALVCSKIYGPDDASLKELIDFYKGILGHGDNGDAFLAYENNFKIVGGVDTVRKLLEIK